MTDCIFCKIVNGDFDTEFLYTDEHVVAFRDISPKAPTHVLIVPREHIATTNNFTEENKTLAGHMLLVASQIAKQLGISESGYRLVFNCNGDGGQEIYHIHLHLLGGTKLSWFE